MSRPMELETQLICWAREFGLLGLLGLLGFLDGLLGLCGRCAGFAGFAKRDKLILQPWQT